MPWHPRPSHPSSIGQLRNNNNEKQKKIDHSGNANKESIDPLKPSLGSGLEVHVHRVSIILLCTPVTPARSSDKVFGLCETSFWKTAGWSEFSAFPFSLSTRPLEECHSLGMYCLRSLIAKGSISNEGQSHSSKLRVLCLSSLRCPVNLLETLTECAEVLGLDEV